MELPEAIVRVTVPLRVVSNGFNLNFRWTLRSCFRLSSSRSSASTVPSHVDAASAASLDSESNFILKLIVTGSLKLNTKFTSNLNLTTDSES